MPARRCSACRQPGHYARTCSASLPAGQKRCACGELYEPTNPKQTRCHPCNRVYQKLRLYRLDAA